MEVTLILKVAGLGFIIGVIDKVLTSTGKTNMIPVIDLIGVIIALTLILSDLQRLFNTVRTIFQL